MLVRQLGVALRVDPFGRAVVDDPVGLKNAMLVIELHRADRRHNVVVLVVDEFVGLEDQLVGMLRRRNRLAGGGRAGLRLRRRAERQRRQDGQTRG